MSGLKIILKPLVIISAFLLPIILFVMLLRLSNDKTSFFGLNDFISWFEQQDFYDPIKSFIDFVNNHNDAMRNGMSQVISSGNIFEFIGNTFRLVGIATGYIAYPVVLIFNIVNMFIQYIIKFFDFINFAINLRG